MEEEEEREEREKEGMVDNVRRTHKKKKRLAYKRKCSVDLSDYHMN